MCFVHGAYQKGRPIFRHGLWSYAVHQRISLSQILIILTPACESTQVQAKTISLLCSSMTSNLSKRRQIGKVCANCTITVSPVWRHAKGLDLTLCNACHICWVTKGVHRPVPPPDVLAKIVAAATKKAEAPANSDRQQGPITSRSGSSSDTDFMIGKRKRVAKKWGTDIDTYGEGSLGRSSDLFGNYTGRSIIALLGSGLCHQ